MKNFSTILAVGFALLMSESPQAIAAQNANAKILIHLAAPTITKACTQPAASPTCSNIVTQGDLSTVQSPHKYFAYLLVVNGSASEGVGALQCGINYLNAPGVGVDILSWTLCATLEFNWSTGWPASDSGTLITWDTSTKCQRFEPGGPGTGVVAVAGYFYCAAYSNDFLRVIPRPVDGQAKVANCASVEDHIWQQSALGFAAFSSGATTPGYNPWCTPSAPQTPTSLSATVLSASSVSLTWTLNGSGATTVEVYRALGSPSVWTLLATLGGTSTAYTDGTTSAGQSLYYRVRAVNAVGPSGYSNTAAVVVSPPGSPTSLTASATSGPSAIALNWILQGASATTLELQRATGNPPTGWSPLAMLPGSATSSTDNSVSVGQRYQYRLRATNSVGSSLWSYSSVVVAGTPPTAPGNLTAAGLSSFEVGLAWSPASHEDSYVIEYKQAGQSSFKVFDRIGAGLETYRASGLVAATSYIWKVIASNESGSAGTVEIAGATQPLEGPQNITIKSEPGSTIEIWNGMTWEYKGVCGPDGTKVINGVSPGSALRAFKRFPGPPRKRNEGPGDLRMYCVSVDSDSMQSNGEYVASVSVDEGIPIYSLPLRHPVVRYNLRVSVESESSPSLENALQSGFQLASDILWNATDGYARLDTIRVGYGQFPFQQSDVYVVDDIRSLVSSAPFAFVGGIERTNGYIGFAKSYTAYGGKHSVTGTPQERERWANALAHELSHYCFGVWDEYENARHNDTLFKNCAGRLGVHALCRYIPVNGYGLMDSKHGEYSTGGDYPELRRPWEAALADYFDNVVAQTAQYAGHGTGCWDTVNEALKRHCANSIGCISGSVDRRPKSRGPLQVGGAYFGLKGKAPEGVRRSGPASYVNGSEQPIKWHQLPQSQAMTVSLNEGSEIHLMNGPNSPGLVAWSQIYSVDSTWVETIVRFDERLEEAPRVTYSIGAVHGEVTAIPVSGDSIYVLRPVYSRGEPSFNGVALFQIMAKGIGGDSTMASIRWEVSELDTSAQEVYSVGDLDWAYSASAGTNWQVGTTTFGPVFGWRGNGLIDIERSHSIWLTTPLPPDASVWLNFKYASDELTGYSADSLQVQRWDLPTHAWTAQPQMVVDPYAGSISGEASQVGTYALFASPNGVDDARPAAVTTLGAFPVQGHGRIGLMWQAVGDDSLSGMPLKYIVRSSPSPITAANWDSLVDTDDVVASTAAGTEEYAEIGTDLPQSATYLCVRALDEAGNLGGLSNVAFAISGYDREHGRTASPNFLRAVDAPGDSGGAVQLSWIRSTDDLAGKATVNGYRVYRNDPPASYPVLLDSVVAGTSNYVDHSSTSGLFYSYWISARDSVSEAFSQAENALVARNTDVPRADFTSDGRVGIDDLSWFVDTYGADSANVEFDPLFDINSDGLVAEADFDSLQGSFGLGGIPDVTPPGVNTSGRFYLEFSRPAADTLELTVRASSLTSLAGYSFRVDYPAGTFTVLDVEADSAGIVPNLLKVRGGNAPLFVANVANPGSVVIASAVRGASNFTAVEGEGVVARIRFHGSASTGPWVSDGVFLDPNRRINYPTGVTAVPDVPAAPRLGPHLFQNYPNPFNPVTTIAFQTTQKSNVKLKIFDVQGRLVRVLMNGEELVADTHHVQWDGRNLSGGTVVSGMYFYRLEAQGKVLTKRMVLVK